MRLGRSYIHTRRAWTPSVWPLVVVAVLVAPLTVYVLRIGIVADALIAGLVSLLAVEVRWWVWRRRHPVISTEEYLQDQRDAARWN